MRSNGLTASSYSPVADVNPTVAEALLDDLKRIQVAAYCQPVESSTVSGLGRPEYLVEVLVRLYVDAAATDRALPLVEALDPLLVRRSEDLTWAQIVAGYDRPAPTSVAPWPVYEDVEPHESLTPDESVEPPESLRPPPATAGPAGWRTWQVPEPADEERFVPPPPPPLPRLSAADKLGWLGLIGGPVVLVASAAFQLAVPSYLTLLAALAFIAGFVSLVVRMDNGDDRFDDPDNGAQV